MYMHGLYALLVTSYVIIVVGMSWNFDNFISFQCPNMSTVIIMALARMYLYIDNIIVCLSSPYTIDI